jgi:orotidine-5'-phosphate decarboxylase
MLTVHTAGGQKMLRAASEAARQADRPPLVIGVTVLTSLTSEELKRIGIHRTVADQVEGLAQLAADAGLDGIVASPREVARLRVLLGPNITIVTPGIRGGKGMGTPLGDDQKRTLGPAEALRAGASYLVVGRPIIESPDPPATARAIVSELKNL